MLKSSKTLEFNSRDYPHLSKVSIDSIEVYTGENLREGLHVMVFMRGETNIVGSKVFEFRVSVSTGEPVDLPKWNNKYRAAVHSVIYPNHEEILEFWNTHALGQDTEQIDDSDTLNIYTTYPYAGSDNPPYYRVHGNDAEGVIQHAKDDGEARYDDHHIILDTWGADDRIRYMLNDLEFTELSQADFEAEVNKREAKMSKLAGSIW